MAGSSVSFASMHALASWPPHSVGAWLIDHGWRIEAEDDPGAPSMPALDRALVLIPPGASRPHPLDDAPAARLLTAVAEDDWVRLPSAAIRTGGRWAPSSLLLAPIAEGAEWSGDVRALVASSRRQARLATRVKELERDALRKDKALAEAAALLLLEKKLQSIGWHSAVESTGKKSDE